LKGLLYINSQGWAIQNIVAEPADFSPMRLKIQQQYERMDSVWFPSELSFELFWKTVTSKGDRDIIYRGKGRIRDIDFAPALPRPVKSHHIALSDNAWRKTELIDLYRDTKLTAWEETGFQYTKVNLDPIFHVAEGLMDSEALAVSIFDFPLERFIQHNYYEGVRYGAGIYTNRHLSPWFSAGGYFGYGRDDRRRKYGASVSLFPEKNMDSEIKFWWANDLYQMAYITEAGVSARRLFGKFDIQTDFKTQDMQIAFDYSFDGYNMPAQAERNTEARLHIRYAHNEERAKMFRRTRPVFTTYPIVYLDLFWGIPDCIGSKYAYFKTEASVERSWYIRNLGHVRFTVRGGWIDSDVPLPLTFALTNVEQSVFFIPLVSAARFNVLTGDVYSASHYLNAFLYHDFGTLLGKTRSKVFRPRISVAQSFGWSKLNRPELHASSELQILDMSKGYFESGLIIEDVIRIEYKKLIFIGFGGGVYGAYGNSVQKPFKDTLTPKIRISGSF
jgi:hypothetical protein